MKKIVALAILGMAGTTAFGQGHVIVSNYLVPPYNQVVWDAGNGGMAVNSADVSLTFWYGAVGSDESALVAGNSFNIDTSLQYDPGMGFGPGGYYSQIALLPDVGDYTLQIRASGNVPGIGDVAGMSSLFDVTTVSTSLPANTADVSPGLVVTASIIPEPTTFALAGLGAAALLVFRRRN